MHGPWASRHTNAVTDHKDDMQTTHLKEGMPLHSHLSSCPMNAVPGLMNPDSEAGILISGNQISLGSYSGGESRPLN